MIVREIKDIEKDAYNKIAGHIIQSWEWGEFRKKAGLDLMRLGHFEGAKLTKAYQLTFHPVPFFNSTIGYLPKGPLPDLKMIKALKAIAVKKNAAFIKIEPNVLKMENARPAKPWRSWGKCLPRRQAGKMENLDLVASKKSLFTKYNFLIDLTKSHDQLLAAMHPKTRYNIRVAQKKGVEVYESVKDKDFEIYLKLYFETTRRQKYFGHTPAYHRLIWQTLKPAGMARLLIANYQPPTANSKLPLVAWMLFNFGDTLYYPYGGSSKEYKEVMASNLIAWEAIKLGKKMGLKIFDMWGALRPDANKDDPWYGFHRFKAGYSPMHVEYIGTYDLILIPRLYNITNIADKLRWLFLRTARR